MAPAADYLILKRRAQEETRMQYEQLTKDNYKAASNAEWEIRTSGYIQNTAVQSRFAAIRAEDQTALQARRQRLGEFLANEQAVFQQQLGELEASPAEMKAKMEKRAGELKDKREGERLAYVRSQYERQWRMACDPLREQESKAILKATNAARAYQIGEKMKALEMEEHESRAFDEMWEKDRQTKLGREEAEDQARRTMDFQHKLVLDQQVAELHSFRDAEKDLAAQEAALLKEQWQLEREEAKKVEAMRHAVLQEANDELHNFNKHKRAQLAASVAEERQQDLERLTQQLNQEKAEDEREAAARASMQEETRRFAEHMLAQKRKLASAEAEMELARKGELSKAWDKRLQVWGQEQEAREKLMAQVLQERKVQVEVKLAQVRIDKIKQAEARMKLEMELEKVNIMEATKLEQSREVRMEHRALLENQIKDKAFKRAAAEFNKVQERMAAERAEEAYQTMLNQQMDKTSSNMSKFASASAHQVEH